ncbi:MAG: hypothetical protein A2231_00595 [Candidatus Firestonebacteria bacterium RIFOXYA2_FULL_40_8]|nr:MAG: hypothetical protein A2231_00595 [Candidatus Firestonebacteria bacterium RIFOXYA2_FULL_40_8]
MSFINRYFISAGGNLMKTLMALLVLLITLPNNFYAEDSAAWKVFTVKDGLASNSIKAIAVDNDNVWFGTKNGLSRMIKKSGVFKSFTTYDGLPSNEITTLAVANSNVWIGTNFGACVYNVDSDRFRSFTIKEGLISNKITSILPGADEVWIGTDNGISVYNKSVGTFTNYTDADGLNKKTVTSIISDGSQILVGTYGAAINVFNRMKKTWGLYAPSKEMYTNIVMTTQGENIWSGTNGGGIRIYNKQTKKWTTFTMDNGLGDENITSLIADGFNLWSGTFDGVSLFSTKQKNWKVYSAKDGLTDASITAMDVDGNFIWFGTDNGVTRFNKILPEVLISSKKSFITSDNEPVDIDCAALSYNKIKSFKVEYSTATFPDIWMTKGITLPAKAEDGRFITSWNITDVPSKIDFYNLKLTATDVNDNTNEAATAIIIDTIAPVVTINQTKEEEAEGMFTLSGLYNKSKIEKIVITPGNVNAIMNPEKKTFMSTTNIREGLNEITVTAYDWVGRTATAVLKIKGKRSGSGQAQAIQVTQNTDGTTGSKLIIGDKMLFEPGSAELKSEVFSTLDKIIEVIKQYQTSIVRIEGHTDNIPTKGGYYKSNLELSNARANNVFNYFVRKGNISPDRLKVEGLGDTKPVASNNTEEGRALNRRVEIVITGTTIK